MHNMTVTLESLASWPKEVFPVQRPIRTVSRCLLTPSMRRKDARYKSDIRKVLKKVLTPRCALHCERRCDTPNVTADLILSIGLRLFTNVNRRLFK